MRSHAPIIPYAARAPETVGAAIERCARAMRRARVHFGHGTDNARDEAAELVFFAAGLPHEQGSAAYGKFLTARRRTRIDRCCAGESTDGCRWPT